MSSLQLVALSKGLPVGIATGGFYIVYRFLEDYLLNPRVMKHTVKVTPGLTIVATLIGGALLGLIGALVAIPWRQPFTCCSRKWPSPARTFAELGAENRQRQREVLGRDGPARDRWTTRVCARREIALKRDKTVSYHR